MNIMFVSVSERRKEIGIKRAIGANPISIQLEFLFEAVIICILGGIVGLILGYIASLIIGHAFSITPIITMRTMLIASLTSICVGVIFGVVPAKRAAKLHPIEAIYR